MKKLLNYGCLVLAFLLIAGLNARTQPTMNANNSKTEKIEMKTYLIEREIPAAGQLTAVQLKEISQKSCGVLQEMGTGIEWIQSYVAGDKIYCIYKAMNAELIRQHALKGGFPANKITEVANVISPATAK